MAEKKKESYAERIAREDREYAEKLKKERQQRIQRESKDLSDLKTSPSVSVNPTPTKKTYDSVTQQKTPKSQKPKTLRDKIRARHDEIKGT